MDMIQMAGKMKENLTKIEMPDELEMLKGLGKDEPEEEEIETTTDKDGKSKVKIPYEILMNFIKIFDYSTTWDKFLLFIGTIFTIVHSGCFLFFAILLDFATEPFLREKNSGYGNETLKHDDFFESMNGTHLFTEDEMIELISEIAVCTGGIGISVLIASFLQTLCWEWAAENQCCRIRDKLAVQILRQEMTMFETHTAGELGFKLINDVESVRGGIGHKMSMVLKNSMSCGVLIGYGLFTHWELTLIFLGMAPLPLIVARYMYYGKSLADKYRKEKVMYGKANTISTDVLTNIRSIAAFAREDLEIDKFRIILGRAADFAIATYRKHAVEIAIFFFLLYGSYALAFERGCKQLMDEEKLITRQELHRMFFGVTMTVFSVAHILPWISTISSAYGSRLVLSEILSSNPKIDASKDVGKRIRHLRGRLKFDNVSFAYESHPEKMVISNVKIEANGNQTIGIIGTGGAGKSTLVNLLLRMYDTVEGAIKIDDVNLKELNVNWLRNHISVVPPHPVFRQDTILKNILAGRNDVPFEEVVAAAKLAEADDFIRSLPQGYETVIGVTGTELARHERNRISITRALVRKPFWLVFDDALADLPDYNKVIEKIRQARRGGATIILSGRTSVVKNSDLIYVLCAGEIVESGKHDELLEKKGAYFEMMKQEKKIPKYDLLTNADEDADLTEFSEQQLIELTPSPKFEYKGFWKMLKLVNRDKKDWHRWKVAAVGCSLTGIALPIFALFFTDVLATFGEEDEEQLKIKSKFWTYFLAGIAVVNGLGYLLRAYHFRVAGEFAILRLRLFTYMSILRRPMSWFDKVENSPSSLSSRLASEVPYIKTALDNRLSICMSALVSFSACVVLSLLLCWQLGLIILGSVPIFAFLIYSQAKMQRTGQVREMELMDYANAMFTQAIQRIWTIQAFTQEEEICDNYRVKIRQDLKERHSHAISFAIMYAISCSFVYFLFAATLQCGSLFIDYGFIEPDVLYRVFLVLTFSLIAAGPTIAFITDITKAELSFTRTLSLIEKEENFEVYPKEQDTTSPWIEGRIDFESVEFRYPNRRSKVLDGCTFSVPTGSMLGLTGGYGAGKTTSLALIQRFYEIDGGRILIDGEDMLGIHVGHLRTNIGYVPTEPDLFNRSIEANISYGYCGEVEGDGLKVLVQEAIEKVDLQNLLERYPDGCNTVIQKDGAGLSTIEKKKIAFARALIRAPRILLIDEPMVGLNANDEVEILKLINKIKVGMTCIVTTARVELLKQTDIVAVLRRGKIIEYGKQDELLAIPNGFYSALVQHEEAKEELAT